MFLSLSACPMGSDQHASTDSTSHPRRYIDLLAHIFCVKNWQYFAIVLKPRKFESQTQLHVLISIKTCSYLETSLTNRTSLAICVVASLALGACATTSQLTTPPLDVSFESDETRADVREFVVLTSRTYLYDANRTREEVQGVPCVIQGHGFQLAYTTPANVRLPTFGIRSSELSMTCTWEEQPRYQPLHVRNLTQESIQSSGTSGGLLGVVLTAGIAAVRGNQEDDSYSYRTPNMDLNERPPFN